mmetsp:Transcript_101782/g.288128  ORF Transcript_101782/g.288128 Transcript_101782/m.288128 type:complete len:250 (+) Transcript_101782:455-1204(+)
MSSSRMQCCRETRGSGTTTSFDLSLPMLIVKRDVLSTFSAPASETPIGERRTSIASTWPGFSSRRILASLTPHRQCVTTRMRALWPRLTWSAEPRSLTFLSSGIHSGSEPVTSISVFRFMAVIKSLTRSGGTSTTLLDSLSVDLGTMTGAIAACPGLEEAFASATTSQYCLMNFCCRSGFTCNSSSRRLLQSAKAESPLPDSTITGRRRPLLLPRLTRTCVCWCSCSTKVDEPALSILCTNARSASGGI